MFDPPYDSYNANVFLYDADLDDDDLPPDLDLLLLLFRPPPRPPPPSAEEKANRIKKRKIVNFIPKQGFVLLRSLYQTAEIYSSHIPRSC